LLLAIVLGSAVALGAALAYPLTRFDFGGPAPVALDQGLLTGQDPQLGLVRLDDLPTGWAAADPALSAGTSVTGAKYCDDSAELTDVVGEPAKASFVDTKNHALLLSESVKFKTPRAAGTFIRDVTGFFDDCKNGRYFRADANTRVEVTIRDTGGSSPISDFVSRTLEPVRGGTDQIVTFFQVGDIVVALLYGGPPNPPKDLMSNVEKEILYRTAPSQFTRTKKVDGERVIPTTAPTTTAPNAAVVSPTSSPDPLPTVAPDPTFTTPTTTRPPRTTTTR
jgi:hypothetical protein